jgi:hypothetical protein
MRRLAAAAALALVFAATWFVLDRSEHRPRWVVVEAPAAAVVGSAFEVRVRLDKSVEATQVSCTLHRANAERRGWGYLASSGPARPAVGGGTYPFEFVVPEKADTAFVFALVYLSPTGEWREGTRAVATALIPVGPESRPLRKVALYHYPTAARTAARRGPEGEGAAPRRPASRPSPWAHSALAALLLAASFWALRAGRKASDGAQGMMTEKRIWLVLAAVLAASAVAEISGLAGELASFGRRLAGQVHVYDYRKPFQKALMAVAASASLGLFFLFIKATRRSGTRRGLWWAGLGVADYLVVSFAGVLSFHAVDVFRELAWHGLSPFDALRGAGAVVTFIAAYLAARRADAPAAT